MNTLTNVLDLLTACSTLKDRHATGTRASATERLKKELKVRKALSTISNAIDVDSLAAGSAGTGTSAAGSCTTVGCVVPMQQEAEQQEAQQEQQARAAAKAAIRQRQKQRKAAEAAAAAEAEQQTAGAAADVLAGAAVEPAAPSPLVASRPTSGASAPAAATGESERPAAAPPHVHQAEAAAAACDEAVQLAGSSPEGEMHPAASGSDQLELLLAQLGAGDAEVGAGTEEQEPGSCSGNGACLLGCLAGAAGGGGRCRGQRVLQCSWPGLPSARQGGSCGSRRSSLHRRTGRRQPGRPAGAAEGGQLRP